MFTEVEEEAIAIAGESTVEVGRPRIAISDIELLNKPRQVWIAIQHGVEDLAGGLDIVGRTVGTAMVVTAVESDGRRKIPTFLVVEDLQRINQGSAIKGKSSTDSIEFGDKDLEVKPLEIESA
jgi:hypothetical protein